MYWADKVLQKDPSFDVMKERTSKRRQPETDGIEKYKISNKTIKWARLLFTLVKLVLLNFFYFYCPFTGSFD